VKKSLLSVTRHIGKNVKPTASSHRMSLV